MEENKLSFCLGADTDDFAVLAQSGDALVKESDNDKDHLTQCSHKQTTEQKGSGIMPSHFAPRLSVGEEIVHAGSEGKQADSKPRHLPVIDFLKELGHALKASPLSPMAPYNRREGSAGE